ncbi:hypothetical protein [Robertmurraya andreesenii]|uniref:Holliday junction resolvasome RuvABC ATP-dependent DNA helicase subunit n=1 Tax=Anoxybacillus andreesenii TaxID=1325932 RepID=A0ABT9V0T7_9BACL|nr:hypothetical protein [Robertmurraya andreesenii]MDQ0154552.1 Holliday junction resolvasome RuvABC ATP-dependent DNA helicase subunit [Robertmurraya andreesenii]
MEWALVALFTIAAVLLIFSYYKNKQAQIVEQREIDTIYMTMMEEIGKLQNQVRSLELESEITAQMTGLAKEDLHLLRESLDLYKRGYTIEGIAGKMKLEQQEVEQLLEPYMSSKSEGRKVANEA